MSEEVGGGRHVPPFYCPYCGEEDIRPFTEAAQWLCAACRRVWTVRFVGIAAVEVSS